MNFSIEAGTICSYGKMLAAEEKSAGTIEKYLRDVRAFASWLGGRALNKEETAGWKQHLLAQGYTPVTVNSMLSALNRFFHFIGRDECRVRFLRIQRRVFRDPTRDLGRDDYERLLQAAETSGNIRLKLLMETICATGIRVSELRHITVEAISIGRAQIALKGKIRTILLPGKLCRKLKKYAQKQNIPSGEIFLTNKGNSLSRIQVWREMKRLCNRAGVLPSRVFPHNLRHLFAVTFYKASKDIVKLADVLGHSNIETTRIYLISTGEEHIRQLEQLRLIS